MVYRESSAINRTYTELYIDLICRAVSSHVQASDDQNSLARRPLEQVT